MILLDRAAGVRGGRHDLSALKDRLAQWWQNYLTRRALRELDPRLLRDVGLTAEQQRRESARRFFE
ncbi:MAG: DUF1127 domain-containing protein [Alphaproteobacteria bacterium]|nr:DUF1127 domain-containing protein [Alphaproteobacteria bacterium]